MSDSPGESQPADDGDSQPWEEPTTSPAAVAETGASAPPLWVRYLALVGLGLVMVFLAGWGVLQITRKVSNQKLIAESMKRGESNISGLRSGPGDAVLAAPPQEPPQKIISTTDAVRRANVLQAQGDIQSAQETLAQLLEQQQKWQQLVPPLLENESGRRIATDAGAVKLLAAAQNRDRITAGETAALRESLLAIALPVESAAADQSAVLELDVNFYPQLQSITQQLETGLKQWRDDTALVRLLAREAKNREPSQVTLASALETLRAREIRDQAEKVAAQVEAAQDQLVNKKAASRMRLQELEAEEELAKDGVEAKRREAKIANLDSKERALAGGLAQARAKAQLELKYKADLPEIHRTLIPFITPGHNQLVNGKWTYLEEKQPLSLSGIRSTTALDDDGLSFQKLYFLGGGSRNDRPNGPFPDYIGGHIHANKMPLARKVQRLLNTYGELMVDKGMLKP